MAMNDEKASSVQTEKTGMMNDNSLEEGLLHQQFYKNKLTVEEFEPSKFTKWGLISLNCALSIIGNIAPMLTRIYYLHGGNLKWMPSCLQSVCFPMLLVPITILYLRDRKSGVPILAPPKLMAFSVAIGLITGALSLSYSYGLLLLPVSTFTLILASSLAFTALFSKLIVGQKFTPFSITAIVLMTLGALVIGIRKNSDQLSAVSNTNYLLGFVLTIVAAALMGFVLPCSEYAYAKTTKAVTYSVVLQFMVGANFVATIICIVGMLINKDFEAIPREASEFGLGMTTYYILLASIAVIYPMLLLGTFGLVICTSSLFAGVFGALLVPLIEIASVILFNETFTVEKSFSLLLCLCGFISYFYGTYREEKQQEQAILH